MTDIGGILEAVRQVLDGSGLSVVIGVLIAASFAQFIYHRFVREFRAWDREWDEHEDKSWERDTKILIALAEKRKNDHNLALLDAPEKPKNMFVRLGDDGELVDWSGDHETNSQV